MNNIAYKIVVVFTLFCICMFNSCGDNKSHSVIIKSEQDSVIDKITVWNVTGTFTEQEDSALSRTSIYLPDTLSLLKSFSSNKKLWHNGYYMPKYGQLDLKEVFNINVADTTKVLNSLVTYLSCKIQVEKSRKMFLLVNTKMEHTEYLNGDSLTDKGFKELYIIPVNLKSGENDLVVRVTGGKGDYWYEATLYDSVSIAKMYAEEHTGNIIYPIIKNDTISITESHWNITNSPIKLFFQDVNGNNVAETVLKKGANSYYIPGFNANCTYLCNMVIEGYTVRQPVMKGNFEEIEVYFKSLSDSLPDAHPRKDEIKQLLYRLWKLNTITGKMREEPWYPFKFPWVTYQLEHIFAHLNGTYGNDDNENNFKFITYRSELDGCLQRYLLVTPNSIDKNKKYPLVVVMRPCCEKRYHLYFSPQIAHQFVVNDMQAVANKYNMFIIMPEARMMLNEDMIPFAEAEMKLALADVQEHYNIDENRIYLHANCSGGYRALKFATLNPNLFAAIALYAPVYKRNDKDNVDIACAPETLIKNLRNVPILIFGDPADTHSPTSMYADLVKDCEKHNIPYKLTMKRNTGLGFHGYHRLIVGRDACEFLLDKHKETRKHIRYSFPPKDTTVTDFYSKPFVYVYNARDTSVVYKELVDNIREEYEVYLYSVLPLDKDNGLLRMPMVPDTRVTHKMLSEKNIFLVGEDFTNPSVGDLVKRIRSKKECKKKDDITLSLHNNPDNKDHLILLYTSRKGSRFKHLINYPWKSGFCRRMIAKYEEK